ncbi:hypothetical protein [Hymenobacter norwichensis]|uniref:hypothetical protein n=1 Tax=Hymenobacter norwichensis TaxID=223903 RepID=UPI0003B7554C|nr:hypothetical protein [Hymenobacter norwichensis]
MKKLVLTNLTLCLSVAAFAQQPAPESSAITTTPFIVTKADTAQAVRVLFAKRRTGGWVWTTVGAVAAVRIATASASGDTGGNASGAFVGATVVGGIPAGIGIGKLTRFSKAKEDAVLTVYSQSKTLPPYVSRRLKSKYFE